MGMPVLSPHKKMAFPPIFPVARELFFDPAENGVCRHIFFCFNNKK